MNCVDLEIGLYNPAGAGYVLELRYNDPNGDTEKRIRKDAQPIFDFAKLRKFNLQHEEYSKEITAALFHDKDVVNRFVEARTIARRSNIPLRVRLAIGPNAQHLHSCHWELLRDPDDHAPLGTSERILFSRYIASYADDPAGPRPKSKLRVLIAISNPKELEDEANQTLPPLGVAKELERAQQYFETATTKCLASHGEATLKNIIDHLRNGYDILYLACHGQFVDNQTRLYLEDDEGNLDLVSGDALVDRFMELQERPRMIIFASCESAGTETVQEPCIGGGGALAPIGPTLAAEAGIGAVIAMQGNVLETTFAEFMASFCADLQRHGLVDRAVAVARGAVRDRPDWWVPVLFMRLNSGRIWYTKGFVSTKEDDTWRNILNNMSDGHTTPILGPGLVDHILGSRPEIARRWAKEFHFPLAKHSVEDLPQVAQYLAVKRKQSAAPQQELRSYLVEYLWRHYGSQLPDSIPKTDLGQVISAVGRLRRQTDEFEPHKLLAQLPIKIYVTTNASNMLADAISETKGNKIPNKIPRVEWCRWNENITYSGRHVDGTLSKQKIDDREPSYEPDSDNPLIYHLFGHLDDPDSLVVTEDDYFDFLLGSTSNKDLIPEFVRSSLTNAGLLFLGYQLDDWNFRVLFRSIIRQEGSSRRGRYAQVAVQFDPEESRIIEPERARDYLRRYFQRAGDINVYWGNSIEFLKELHQRWLERSGGQV